MHIPLHLYQFNALSNAQIKSMCVLPPVAMYTLCFVYFSWTCG